MDYRERDPIQYTLRMETARAKQEEETNTRIMQESSMQSGRTERKREEEKSQTKPN